MGRPADTIAHPLMVLEDTGFVERLPDAFRANRTTYRIAEPLVSFYHAVMRPNWGRLERPGSAEAVWTDRQAIYRSLVLGPHFETIARSWVQHCCAAATLGGGPTWVRPGVLNDPWGPPDR